jgi:putative ABC transport system substrate-binding protein
VKLMKWLLAAALLTAANGAALADPKLVEIASFGEHPALNQVAEGFKTRMSELGYVEGKDSFRKSCNRWRPSIRR